MESEAPYKFRLNFIYIDKWFIFYEKIRANLTNGGEKDIIITKN